jgi:hypothetical protein
VPPNTMTIEPATVAAVAAEEPSRISAPATAGAACGVSLYKKQRLSVSAYAEYNLKSDTY